jgi:hypothetical protein
MKVLVPRVWGEQEVVQLEIPVANDSPVAEV